MSYQINLDDIDVDGAIREAAHEVSGDTRLSFLKKATIAGGAVVSGGTVLSALAPTALAAGGGRPPASLGNGDIGILNYALTLEYLEAAFYNGATAANLSLGSQGAAFLKVVTKDENAHVKFMKTAQVLENTGVHAYSGQALNIKSPAYVKAALSILTIEARHASVIGLLNEPAGEDIAPDGPFDTPFTAAKVLAAVKGTGFIVG